MTTLRFTGEFPLWAGLSAALLVSVMAWRYYRRESFDLTPRLRWLLPLLRSAAFFLGVMLLTGPVLHHRSVIGEPGVVKIYVDASESMSLADRHLDTAAKLLIAEEHGWIEAGRLDRSILQTADDLHSARTQASAVPESDAMAAERMASIRDSLVNAVEGAVAHPTFQAASIPDSLSAENVRTALIEPLRALQFSADAAESDSAAIRLAELSEAAVPLEGVLRDEIVRQAEELAESGDAPVQAAVGMFDETTRWRRAEQMILSAPQALFRELRGTHEVQIYALKEDSAVRVTESVALEADSGQLPDSPDGRVTDLVSGVRTTQSAAGHSVSETEGSVSSSANTAVVLITDGRHNSGPSPLESARRFRNEGIPIFAVSMGAAEHAPDLAVREVDCPQLVYRHDRVSGSVTIADHMTPGQPFTVRIEHDGVSLWEEQLLTESSGERQVNFEFRIEELIDRHNTGVPADVRQHALPLRLKALITPLEGEHETRNNEFELRLAAITENHRLLVLDGRPRWETRYLKNAFDRDTQWDVNLVIAADAPSLRRGSGTGMFPESREELFEYDLVILGELDDGMLSDAECSWLREFVESRGGGLILIDGQRQRLRTAATGRLGTLVPVEWTDDVFPQPEELRLTDVGASVTALNSEQDTEQNREFWSRLPPPHSVQGVGPLPGAEVLAEAVAGSASVPAVVTRRTGAGRVLYLSFDETWRWRYKAADLWHQRIWNQLARYVMARPYATSDEYVAVDAGGVAYDQGDSAAIRVRLHGTDGKPVDDATVDALLWRDGRFHSAAELSPDPNVPGVYRGTSPVLPAGEFEMSVRASGFSDEALRAKAEFTVRPIENAERLETAANDALLRQMAADSGGIFLREYEAGQLSDLLSPLSHGYIVEKDTLLWQSYWWLAVVVILLGVEWFLRKRAGLL